MTHEPHHLCTISHTIFPNYSTLQLLKSIKHKIIPVCAVGSTLTGKSSFLNQLIGQNVFPIGNTTNPTTKGIWIYPHTVHCKHQSICLLFMDCQGFDNLENTPENDLKLLVLLLALNCNMFYLSFGALDTFTVNRIGSLKERVESLIEQQKGKRHLTFVQKDFSLELVDKFQNQISPEEYLEMSLSAMESEKNLYEMFHKNISCILVPNTCTNKEKTKMNAEIQTKILLSEQIPSSHFIHRFMFFSEIIAEEGKIPIFYKKKLQSKIEEEVKIQWQKYKEKTSSAILKVRQSLPIQSEAISHNIQLMNQQLNPYLQQLIGQKIQHYFSKTQKQLIEQNTIKCKQFIQKKVSFLLQHKKKQLDNKIMLDIQEQLYHFAFINEKDHSLFIRCCVNEQFYRQCNEEKQKMAKQMQKKDFQIQELKDRIVRIQEQHKNNLQSFHSLIHETFNCSSSLCVDTENKLLKMSHITEDINKNGTFKKKQIISLIKDLSQTLKRVQSKLVQQINKQQESIFILEQSNQNLLEQVQKNRTSAYSILEQQYYSLKYQNEKLIKDYEMRIEVKENKIEELVKKLNNSAYHHNLYEQELGLVRSALVDKGKGSQFLQKIIREKDIVIEDIRKQMMDRIEAFKEELLKGKLEYDNEVKKLTEMVSMYAVKNEQLVESNRKLQQKNRQMQKREKEKLNRIEEEQSAQINKLKLRIKQTEKDLEEATDSSKQVVSRLEHIIYEKQHCIAQCHSKIGLLEQQMTINSSKINAIQEEISQKKEKINELELEKQEIESRSRREQVLLQNKNKYIEHQYQKLKVEAKEKESMFEVMLLQLRGKQIIDRGFHSNVDQKRSNFNSLLTKVENHIKKELGREKILKENQQNTRHVMTEKKERNSSIGVFKTIVKH